MSCRSVCLFNPFALCVSLLIGGFGAAYAQNFNDAKPNAEWQVPAFQGQTRAPILNDEVQLKQERIAGGLETPWGMDQLPDGRWLVTERVGRLRIVSQGGEVSAPVDGLPKVFAFGQGGLLDVVVRENFEQTRRIWWSFSEPLDAGKSALAVATGILSTDEARLLDVEVIFQQQPAWLSPLHFGSRLVFDNEGALFVTTGERSHPQPRQLAQDVTTHLGKVLRIDPKGGPATGNPNIEGGAPEIWSYGHRNIQSAALAPDGTLWTVEHGPRGGDELNQPQPGKNYGWPIITYGEEYIGTRVGAGKTQMEGMEQPIYYWDPVIAPSGMAFYQGEMFDDWNGDILIGGLASQALVRLKLDGNLVLGEARYFEGEERIRDVDVDQGDGSIVVLIDSGDGGMFRVTR